MEDKNLTSNKLLKTWQFLRGDTVNFSLESRIFNTLSLVVLLTCFIEIFVNLYLKLYAPSIISSLVVVFHGIIYYQYRFKKRLRFAIIFSGFEANGLLGINYFFNGGINGPSLMLFIAIIFMLMAMTKIKHIWIWLFINIVTIVSLLVIEYGFPQSIINNYENRKTMFADIFISYLIAIILITVCVYYIKSTFYKQKKELEEKALSLHKINEEKDKLFSIISHDLRSPLASVQQYLGFLADLDLEADERKMLEANLIKTTNEAQDMLTNLLQWSKKQLEGNQTFMENVAVETILKSTIKMAQVTAENKGLTLNVSIQENLMAFADADMLQLVIRNLLNNSIKFTPTGGVITFEGAIKNGECLLEISDNGIGISLDKQQDIFSLKAKSTFGTNNEKGTGLGLMLCKEYTVLQGGKIWFNSETGKGTSFYLTLLEAKEEA